MADILQSLDLPVTTIEYLQQPFTRSSLRLLIDALNVSASNLVRINNDTFRNLLIDPSALESAQVIDLLLEHPELFQRPVVLANGKARIGRPPETVLEIL